MKTLTFKIADRLDELAGEWSKHTPQCEALMMAAKEVATFEQEEKDNPELDNYTIIGQL